MGVGLPARDGTPKDACGRSVAMSANEQLHSMERETYPQKWRGHPNSESPEIKMTQDYLPSGLSFIPPEDQIGLQ